MTDQLGFDLGGHSFTNGEPGEFADIAGCLAELRALRIPEVTATATPITPKAVWHITSYQQGMIYRSVALGEGVRTMWNQRNALGAVTLARSIVENSATYWNFERSLSKAVAAKNFKTVYDDTTTHAFNTRWEGMPVRPLPNILTLLKKMDRDTGGQSSKAHSAMSELVHPNWAGTVGLFGRLDKPARTYRFNDTEIFHARIASLVIAGAGSLRLIQLSHERVNSLLPAIWELSEADAARGDR